MFKIFTKKLPALANFSFVSFSIKEQVLFAKRLAFLAEAGVSLVDSLLIIIDQTKSARKKMIFAQVKADVLSGKSLALSLAKYPKLFGAFTINIIRVGENTGTLATNLTYLAEELHKKHKLQRKIRSALMYPIFISVTTFGVTGLLISYIFPKIMPIFLSLNITLPLLTRMLLALSKYLQDWGLLSLVGLIVFISAFVFIYKYSAKLRKICDQVIINLPVVGKISRSYNCANFCRTLSLNLRSGVSLHNSLQITASVLGNCLYKNASLKFAESTLRGEKISQTMKQYPHIFSGMIGQIISIGETTGKLADSLSYLGEQYEEEVGEQTKNLSESIEPILLLTMGILVGVIAISIITPIYEVTKYLGSGH